jgi:hypothetical protein
VEIKTRLWPLPKHKRQHSFEMILWRDWLVRQARSTYDWSKQWTWARSVLGKTKGQGWRSKKLCHQGRKEPKKTWLSSRKLYSHSAQEPSIDDDLEIRESWR